MDKVKFSVHNKIKKFKRLVKRSVDLWMVEKWLTSKVAKGGNFTQFFSYEKLSLLSVPLVFEKKPKAPSIFPTNTPWPPPTLFSVRAQMHLWPQCCHLSSLVSPFSLVSFVGLVSLAIAHGLGANSIIALFIR